MSPPRAVGFRARTSRVRIVRAAGGVVWRRSGRGIAEVLLVHRPLYDDWTLPKGTARDGESNADCALRGVTAETGLVCSLGPALLVIAYDDSFGRRKLVQYFAMEPLGAALLPGESTVDEARWVSASSAARVLSYPREVGVVEALRQLVGA